MTPGRFQCRNTSERSVYLRVLREGTEESLLITLEEKDPGEEITLQQYVRGRICSADIQSLVQESLSLLQASDHSSEKGAMGKAGRLEEIGQHLYDSLLPLPIKERLASTESRNLFLLIDDSLVGIPWEILYDGEEFFCLRYNIGRLVTTSHPMVRGRDRDFRDTIRILIVADPRKDLPASYEEGLLLSQRLEAWGGPLETYLETTNIDSKKIIRRLPRFDILHYAGHAVYNQEDPGSSGWYLEDGLLTAQDIMRISGGRKAFPSLIFSNACRSGQTAEWSTTEPHRFTHHAFDLVNVFLRSGVQHYIGTLQDISDPASFALALSFYQLMMERSSIGDCLRRARLRLIDEYGRDNLIWAYYMLYGDPTICYLERREEKEGDTGGEEPEKGRKRKDDSSRRRQVRQEPEGVILQGYAASRTGIPEGASEPSGETPLGTSQAPPSVRKGSSVKWRLKWMGAVMGGLVSLTLIFYVISKVGPNLYHPDDGQRGIPPIDHEWEQKKWQIVQQIQGMLNKRYKEALHPIASSHGPYTICIVPAMHEKRMNGHTQTLTRHFIEEFHRFWMHQTDFVVVERERLDFVLEELERATSYLTENQVKFAIGKLFGAKGILFVMALPGDHLISLPFMHNESKIFVRCVETETSVIRAMAEASVRDGDDLKVVSQNLGREVVHSLGASNVR
ncbi:MAG: CHAT domain-containing protein [bacterium]